MKQGKRGECERGVALLEREGALSKDLSEGRNGDLSTLTDLNWHLHGAFQEWRGGQEVRKERRDQIGGRGLQDDQQNGLAPA